MKKKIFIVMFVLLSFILVGCGKEEEVVKPKLTLDTMAELINSNYAIPKIKCSAFKTNKVLSTLNDYVLLSDHYLYSILKEPGKQYSNGEQCMRVNDQTYMAIIANSYFLGTDNKMYSSYDFKENTYFKNINNAEINNWIELQFTDAEKEKYKSTSEYKKGIYMYTEYAKYLVLKTDGSIYQSIYKFVRNGKTNKITSSVYSERVLYSNTDYGHIDDFRTTGYGVNQVVDLIISSKGVFVRKKIETEECLKYEDIECETRMVLLTDYSYNKYKDEIKYYDKNIVITNNNSILNTSLVFNINDARKNYERLFEGYEK